MSGTWASSWALNDIVSVAEFAKGVGCVADSTLGASAASIDFTGLPTTYAHLVVVVYGRSDNAGTQELLCRFNNDSAANYDIQRLSGAGATATSAAQLAATGLAVGYLPGTGAGANIFGGGVFYIPNYANSTNKKVSLSLAGASTLAGTNLDVRILLGQWSGVAAINRLTLYSAAGNLVAGSRVSVYVKGA